MGGVFIRLDDNALHSVQGSLEDSQVSYLQCTSGGQFWIVSKEIYSLSS